MDLETMMAAIAAQTTREEERLTRQTAAKPTVAAWLESLPGAPTLQELA